MTDAEKIKYLGHYRYLSISIDIRLQEAARFTQWAERDVSPKLTDKCLSIAGQIQKEIQQREQTREQIEAVINTVTDDRCRDLLRYRYMNQLPWDQVAGRMCYCLRNVHRLHSKALSQVVIP